MHRRPDEPSVTATLIVRDEERFLAGCLDTLAGRVDEIVVADTGSTDRSRDIAREHGARLIEHRWTDDFAAARNAALDAARGDWILYIDADERVAAWDRAALRPLLADPGIVACTVLFRPQSGFTRYREHRLFRRRADLRFRGVIHESIRPALHALQSRTRARIADSPAALDHLGYDGDLAAKHRRNRPLLEARLAAEPDHAYSRDHLGLALLGLGDEAGAEDAWRRAIAAVCARGWSDAGDSLPFLHLASFLLDRGRDARAILDDARRRFPDDHALAWLDARAHLESGNPEIAQPIFEALARVDVEALCMPYAYDASIFGANAHAAAGLCAFRRGRYGESADRYARAEALVPAHAEFRIKRLLAQARDAR
ncbi:SPbeta prophage-derived glycosyltransferase SunS [Burkholderiales bacterium]|nr:SPbeta prophage-derived glycosyltransferase SunS [Burkholderiales bacterium]